MELRTRFRADHDSICIIEHGGKLPDDRQVKLRQPRIAASLDTLQHENRSTGRSLGIIRPDPGASSSSTARPKADDQRDDQGMQASFCEKPPRPLTPPEFVFGYKHTSAGRPHTNTHQDQEAQAPTLPPAITNAPRC